MNNVVKLLEHQWEFIQDTTTPFVALVSGYRGGKTHALCHKMIFMASNAINKGYPFIAMEPTYGMIKRVLEPTMVQALEQTGVRYTHRKQDCFILHFPTHEQVIWLLSAENYLRAQGISAGAVFCDEIDLLRKDVATAAWETLVSRLTGGHQQAACCSTPEGFNFLYDTFVLNATDKHRLIKARTRDNPFIPAAYFGRMKITYNERMLSAYLDGEFVNLTSGNVYYPFDRRIHHTDKTLNDFPNHILHIGVDFNVGKTCGVVSVIDKNIVYIIDEIVNQQNTEALINEIRRRYQGKTIHTYPDSSGKSAHTNASITDIALLKKYFIVNAHNKNPEIRDRVNSVNGKLLNAKKEIGMFINTNKCKNVLQTLEQQGYVDGKPDKQSGLDHIGDAVGYLIWFRFPITGRPTMKQIQ